MSVGRPGGPGTRRFRQRPGTSRIGPSGGARSAGRSRGIRGSAGGEPPQTYWCAADRRPVGDAVRRSRRPVSGGCGAAGGGAAGAAAGGDRGARLRRQVHELWRADDRRGAGRAGAGPDVRASHRGAAGVPALRPPPFARAAGRRLRRGLRPPDQRGCRRRGPRATRNTSAARGGRHPGGGAGEPGHQLRRDRGAGGRAELVALGVPGADRELPRHRAEPRGLGGCWTTSTDQPSSCSIHALPLPV